MPAATRIRHLKKGDYETDKDGSSWVNWWVFPAMTPEQAEDTCDQYGIERYYCGPGQGFCNRPVVRHGKNVTTITQFCGYDV